MMGRRPNATIQEFFDRGSKLDDNSNRYQHTCKRCGTFFPKGRIDSLTNHLLRRCPNLGQPDRTWIFHQVQQNAEKPAKTAKRSYEETSGDASARVDEAPQSELPLPFVQQQRSALDTLAEVSRHYSSRGDAHRQNERQITADSVAEAIAGQALLAHLQKHGESVHNSAPIGTTGFFDYPTAHPAARQDLQSASQPSSAPVSSSTSPLVKTASAANRRLEEAQVDLSPIDAQPDIIAGSPFQNFSIPIDMGFKMGEPNFAANITWDPPAATSMMTTFGSLSIPQHDPMAGYGILSSNAKQKPRGRFHDWRRKEVSEIRKQGACLRCRMLKKSCSGETPCKTCASVESARIWKGKCVRTRLADEMTLWSAKLLQTQARGEPLEIFNEEENDEGLSRVQVTLSNSTYSVVLAASSYRPSGSDVSLNPRSENGNEFGQNQVRLTGENDRLANKIGAYALQNIGSLGSLQPPLIKDILDRAQTSPDQTAQGQAARSTESTEQRDAARSHDCFQDDLAKNVQELWALTQLLTEQCSLQFRQYVGESTEPLSEVEDAIDSAQPGNATVPIHYRLARAQLFAAMESQCSKLSKSVLNELERRLLQRQQTSRFATLLSAIILLSSVERMAGYYSSFDSGGGANEEAERKHGARTKTTVDNTTIESDTHGTNAPPKSWPLETATPSDLWPQGERFADLLISLLRMRALPPKTKVNVDGVLASIREFVMPVQQGTSQTVQTPNEEPKDAAADWLDSLQLGADALKRKRDSAVPAPGEGLEAWSLRFVARLLLPEKGG